MLNRKSLTLLVVLVAAFPLCAFALEAPIAARAHRFSRARAAFLSAANDREQDGLSGPVRRAKTETAKITTKNGKPAEGPRVLLETATYDIKGAKIDNAYFLAAAGGTLTGKEVYKYDDKGNIVEMTLHNADGTLVSKEVYTYEFDNFGNWTKMITSVAVIEGGKMSFEPTEVSYRTFSYFLDEATMAKMSQPATPAAGGNNNNASAATASVSPSAQPVATDNKANVGVAVVPPKSSPAPATVVAKPDAAKSDANKVVKSESKMAAAPSAVGSVERLGAVTPAGGAGVKSNSSSAAPLVVSEGEAPARPIARGPLKPISGGVLNGKAVSLPQPLYPELAKRTRAAGMVTIEVVVDVTGRVISAKAVSGPTILQAAAEKAAMQARFSPTLLSGQAVRVSGQIAYNFTLN